VLWDSKSLSCYGNGETDNSHIPEVLDGCDWIVEPEKPGQFAGTIKCVFNYPDRVSKNGLKAREKCKREYGWDAVKKGLVKVFEKFETKNM